MWVVHYQPDFESDEALFTPEGTELWSYYVYRNYDNAKKDFPNRKIIAYQGDDIENPYFIDGDGINPTVKKYQLDISVDVVTSKPIDDIIKAARKGIIKEFDSPTYRICSPTQVHVKISDVKNL